LGNALGIELLPTVFVVGVCRDGFRFRHLRLAELHVAIDADAGGKEVPRHAGDGGAVGHVDVDQGAVAHDLALGRMDEPHPAHVGRKLIDLAGGLVSDPDGGLAGGLLAQVQEQEFGGSAGGKFRGFDVHAAHPIALALEPFDQVTADESTGSAYDRSFHLLLPGAESIG